MSEDSGDIPTGEALTSARVTHLLHRWQSADEASRDALFRAVHAELYQLASAMMRGQPVDHTLQASALINEAFLKLADGDATAWEGRVHFFAVASRAMRSILVDHGRRKRRAKRRPPGARVPLDSITVCYEERAIDIEALDSALEELARRDDHAATVVELRFFGGATLAQIAEHLGITVRAVERDWEFARAWLHRVLRSSARE
ncbi:MAG: sigma-70 family RNA polymerase sigma factor [Planctomycetes bacterium]|nr:sigma-70 family RNA polymerase sigma factor [Planctomycetota bacterium]